MVAVNLSGRCALITGGTKGIGLAAGMELGRAGARVFATYKWGSADLDDIKRRFAAADAPEPVFIRADVSVEEDTAAVMAELEKHTERIDIFISNVGFSMRTPELADYRRRSLYKTLDYSTWPLIDYTLSIYRTFGTYPRHILAISSDGPDHYYRGYDFVAASKALLEFFSRYLSAHLVREGSRVNVIRFGTVKTESFDAIFGAEFFDYLRSEGVPDELHLTPEECGKAILAFCSGLLDAVSGQIVTIDYGLPFLDNFMMRFQKTRD